VTSCSASVPLTPYLRAPYSDAAAGAVLPGHAVHKHRSSFIAQLLDEPGGVGSARNPDWGWHLG
jgi:hypothetical protein